MRTDRRDTVHQKPTKFTDTPSETPDWVAFDYATPTVTRVGLRQLMLGGRQIHARCLANTADEAVALAAVEDMIRPSFALRPDRPWTPDTLDEIDRADVGNAYWNAKWCASGFPRIRVRSARAALLAATAIPAEHVCDVRPPWPAFIIHLEGEDQLLVDPERPGVFYDQLEVLYSSATGQPTWTFFRRAPSGVNYFRLWSTPEEWGSALDSERLFDRDGEDAQARLFQVASRIVLGLCIHLTTPRVLDDARQRARSKRFRNDRSGPPQMNNLVIGNDVKVDVTDPIREYLRRGGGAPKVQSLVRGHWKRQPCGPHNSLRKWIHVDPYWKGPEDGPVVVRSHVLADRPLGGRPG